MLYNFYNFLKNKYIQQNKSITKLYYKDLTQSFRNENNLNNIYNKEEVKNEYNYKKDN